MPHDARRDVTADRLHALRGDLAALRARTARDVTLGGSPSAEPGHPPHPSANPPPNPPSTPPPAAPVQPLAVDDLQPPEGEAPVDEEVGPTSLGPQTEQGGRSPRWRGGRAPRPPRRSLRSALAVRPHRPPRRLRVPTPVPVQRRPDHVAPPRWPTWTARRAAIGIAVGLPAVLQLAHRLLHAMTDTSVLLGADPSRSDYLHAAAGVGGGGLTLALAVAALAIVRGRPGYLTAAVGVLAAFVALPWMVYTANGGIVAAATPGLGDAIAPDGWGAGGLLWLTFWLCAGALVVAAGDLLVRSTAALGSLLDRGRR